MARGWDSKAVEDQIIEHSTETQKSANRKLSKIETERHTKREALLLARARNASTLETASNVRHRELLEKTLAHLDAELAALEREVQPAAAL